MHLNLPLKKNLISINQIKRKTHLIITQNKRWKKSASLGPTESRTALHKWLWLPWMREGNILIQVPCKQIILYCKCICTPGYWIAFASHMGHFKKQFDYHIVSMCQVSLDHMPCSSKWS
jgi:hypothetical protein